MTQGCITYRRLDGCIIQVAIWSSGYLLTQPIIEFLATKNDLTVESLEDQINKFEQEIYNGELVYRRIIASWNEKYNCPFHIECKELLYDQSISIDFKKKVIEICENCMACDLMPQIWSNNWKLTKFGKKIYRRETYGWNIKHVKIPSE